MSYTERLRAIETARAAAPKREYITNAEYAKLKAALTRAKNTGDPERVLRAVEAAVEVFDSKIWPDDWSSWRIALEDASQAARMRAHRIAVDDEYDRLMELSEELHAASLILFR